MIWVSPRDWSLYLKTRMLKTEQIRTTKIIRMASSLAGDNTDRGKMFLRCRGVEKPEMADDGAVPAARSGLRMVGSRLRGTGV
jgi:hypothetical protein